MDISSLNGKGVKLSPCINTDCFRVAGFLCAMGWALWPGTGFPESPVSAEAEKTVELTAPPDRSAQTEDTAIFRWRVSPSLDSVVHHYEITFWSTARIFRKRIPVIPESSQGGGSYHLPFVNSEFRKHGHYFWRVVAVDSQGHQTQSGSRSFLIPRPTLSKFLSAWYFPYEVQFGVTHRVQSEAYQQFLNRMTPSTHLESYGDFSLFFKQPDVFGIPFDLEERFYVLSSVGLGSDWSLKSTLYRNQYMAFSPEVRGGVAWFSTGLKQFSSLQYHMYVGGNCEILPKSYVTFFGGWVPLYRVRYAETRGGIRTFLGEGWECGVKLVIPHTMIPVFRFAGIDIDFERIPLVVSISHIRDGYTDVVMKNRCLGVGYLFR